MSAARGRVGVISNPASGHNRDQFDTIRAQLEACPNLTHVVTHSPAEIDDALARLAGEGIAVLAINGGDGTNSAILGRVLETRPFGALPLVALLPAGTANMNAGDVGIRGSLPKAVARLRAWCDAAGADDAPRQRRRLLKVECAPEAPRYTMFIGAGAVIHGTEYAHEKIHSRALRDDLSVALGTVRTVWGVLRDDPRFNRHVTIDLALDGGAPERHDTLILAVSTLRRLAFGMRPFWSDTPGAVRVTVMDQGCTKFARTFFSIARGKPNRNAVPASGYHSYNADAVALRLAGKLNLDGEIIEVDGDVQVSATEEFEFLVL